MEAVSPGFHKHHHHQHWHARAVPRGIHAQFYVCTRHVILLLIQDMPYFTCTRHAFVFLQLHTGSHPRHAFASTVTYIYLYKPSFRFYSCIHLVIQGTVTYIYFYKACHIYLYIYLYKTCFRFYSCIHLLIQAMPLPVYRFYKSGSLGQLTTSLRRPGG